ncbi:hypothetical protein [Prevotella intermedia]|jgi:hypothetical protein|uniref:Uncharacterized protein n=1 Tax=Prevotella intermedia TaxID=28131 RepID=A0A2D3L716_PREIN|nr:hypothetical protein [Prevotella intermedia]ATV26374.1 hypothetical protein CTM62_06340 [Prevotella intermedia]
MEQLGFFGFENLSKEEVEKILRDFDDSGCHYKYDTDWENGICRAFEIFGEVPFGYEEMVSAEPLWDHEHWVNEYKETFKDWKTHQTNARLIHLYGKNFRDLFKL